MSLDGVRSYFKSQLVALDSSFREHKDGFEVENIEKSRFNKAYHIFITNPTNVVTNNCMVQDNISVVVKLFFKGGKTSRLQTSLDDAMDIGHDYKLKASNLKNFTSVIKQVVGDSVTPTPLESNDNSFIITVSFTVLGVYSVI